jgi:hypothetical protein
MQRITGMRLGRCCALLAALLCATATTTAVKADDAGIAAFFRQQFGIGDGAPEPSVSAPSFDEPVSRPLVVRRHRRPAVHVEAKVGPVGPVSIYDDRTLRAGDAVMTAKGLRVFVGGHGAPYTDADFVAVSEADGLPRQVEKALLVIDKAPRS